MTHQAVEPGDPGIAPPSLVVLLVDDQRFVGAALSQLLAGEPDITLRYCYDAELAVAQATAVAPALILQDLVMPDIDGLALIRTYRSTPAISSTPVIVLSGTDDAAARNAAFEAGAVDFLVKLPAKDVLLDAIRRHIGKTAVAQPQHAAAKQEDDAPTLDLVVLAGFRQGPGADFTVMLIDQFLQEADRRVEALRDATSRQDAAGLRAASHALKGSALIMGAKRLGALCGRMERGSEDPAGVAAAPALMASINAELVRVRRALATERNTLSQPAAGSLDQSPSAHSLTTQS